MAPVRVDASCSQSGVVQPEWRGGRAHATLERAQGRRAAGVIGPHAHDAVFLIFKYTQMLMFADFLVSDCSLCKSETKYVFVIARCAFFLIAPLRFSIRTFSALRTLFF